MKAAETPLEGSDAEPSRDGHPFAAGLGSGETLAALREEQSQRVRELLADRERMDLELTEIRLYVQDLEAALKGGSKVVGLLMEGARRASGRAGPESFTPLLAGGGWKRLQPKAVRAAEVERYVHHLWGGLSVPAKRELQRIIDDANYLQTERARAVQALSSFLAFEGDNAAALEALRNLDRFKGRLSNNKTRWIKEGFVLLGLGDVPGAQAAFQKVFLLPDGAFDPDAGLALTNCMGSDAQRLAQINQVLAWQKLAPIEMISEDEPLSIDNIRTAKAHCGFFGGGKVSVILPCFNAEDRIGTALASLVAQTYRDLEIIVVDDASTDGTVEIAQEFARRDRRVVVLRQAVNGGAYAARNRGLAAATGEFITTHDADDWSHSQKIEKQLSSLTGDHIGIVSFWARTWADLRITPNWRLTGNVLFFSHSSFLFRRELTDRLGPWDPARVGADSDLMNRAILVYGEQAIVRHEARALLALALDQETSLTRAKQTHVRTVHHGLRQIYHAVSRADRESGTGPALRDRSFRQAALPPEVFAGSAGPVELDLLLMGDCTSPGIVAEMRDVVEAQDDRARIGVFHWPDLDAEPAELGHAYAALLADDRVRAVLPGAKVRLTSAKPRFFGAPRHPVDDPPEIID